MRSDFQKSVVPSNRSEELMLVYHTLLVSNGHQNWWPSEGWFETIIGAILAQNVSWSGAFKAVSALKAADLLDPEILARTSRDRIASLIRSSRYYNQKTAKIHVFVRWFLDQYQGNILVMQKEDTRKLRDYLLSLNGFGPETVDSILLYACNKPVFVVDAYTRRIGSRIGWYPDTSSYQEMQTFFLQSLPHDSALFNDYHAQMVNLGSRICKKDPSCRICPIRQISGISYCIFAGSSDNTRPEDPGNKKRDNHE